MTTHRPAGSRHVAGVAVFLAVLAVVVFLPVLENGFVRFDDDKMVYNNPQVKEGLSPSSARWALTVVEEGNWFPLTRLTHLADVSLYGLAPRGHHATNLALHGANTALLFLVLRAFTGALWPSAAAAALFGLHPLRVEAVAWVSERKELLAFLFGMLTLAAYRRYVRRPGAARMALVALGLGLGLAAKPVLVTLPVLLLILDFWPLGRLGRGGPPPGRAVALLLAEKLPLFLLAAGGGAVAWYAQRSGGAMTMLVLPPAERLANAFVSCVRYLGKFAWPDRLAAFYPHPGHWPIWAVAGACAVVGSATLGAFLLRRCRPWALAGWAWFLVALLPMLGIVQIGWQSMADRYTYLPAIGICLMLAWAGAEAIGRRPVLRGPLVAATLVILLGLAVQTRRQATVWRDTISLFNHALAATGENWLAHQNLGAVLVDQGKAGEAVPHLREAARARPDIADVWYNLGCAHISRREWVDAENALRLAISLDPRDADYYGNLGVVYFSTGRLEAAAAEFRRALERNPGLSGMRKNLEMAEGMLKAMRAR